MPVIGLVGGVAAGKSTVAAEMERLGAAVVDGDRIGHKVLLAPAVRQAIRRRWGA
jgi:dephospho-CoA kinase